MVTEKGKSTAVMGRFGAPEQTVIVQRPQLSGHALLDGYQLIRGGEAMSSAQPDFLFGPGGGDYVGVNSYDAD